MTASQVAALKKVQLNPTMIIEDHLTNEQQYVSNVVSNGVATKMNETLKVADILSS